MWVVSGDALVGYEARREVVGRRKSSVARPTSLFHHGDVVTAGVVASIEGTRILQDL